MKALCVWVWAYTVLSFSLQYSNSKMKLLNCSLLLLLASGSSAFSPIAFAPRQPSALGVAVDTSDIKNGMTLELEGEPYKVLSFSIMKQARGAAKTTIKVSFLLFFGRPNRSKILGTVCSQIDPFFLASSRT